MSNAVQTPAEPGGHVTVPALIDRWAREAPTAMALIDETTEITYGDLAASSRRLAAALAAGGIRPGARVGLCLPNSIRWAETHLALSRIGAVSVGINPRYPAPEVSRILAAADAHALVFDSEAGANDAWLADLLAAPDTNVTLLITAGAPNLALRGHVNVLDTADPALAQDGDADEPDPSAPSTVFTSSGSTGTPKLIAHSQAAIAGHSLEVADAFGYTETGTTLLGQLPLCGVWGFNTVYAALAAGATCVLMRRFEAGPALDLIEKHAITHANGPDGFLKPLFVEAEKNPDRVASLREVGFSTFSNDSIDLVLRGDKLGVALFQVYGSSEQQALMLRQPGNAGSDQRAVPGGRPARAHTQARIRDLQTGALAIFGAAGALETRGPHMMLGYLTDGALDQSAFTEDGWLRTGDIAELDEHGVRYLSRGNDVLRLSGFLVDPGEIETHLEQWPGIREAKVVGVDTDQGPKCIAFVLVATPDAFDPAPLLDHCRHTLATFKVPLQILTAVQFPQVDGANGPRIQRRDLRTLAQEALR